MDRNPLDSVEPPVPLESDTIRPTLEEAIQIIHLTAETRIEPAVCLALGAGLRRSEALGARWEDVDLEARLVRVQQKRVRPIGKSDFIGKPKTRKSKRTKTMTDWAARRLRDVKKRQLEERLLAGSRYQESGLVVVDKLGKPLSPWTTTRQFTKLLLENNMRHITFKGLRHGFATLSVMAGVDLPVLSAGMGHSNTKTTEIYYEILRESDIEAARKLDRLFEQSS